MTWCKFRLVKPCWRGFSPISLMWGCRVFPARDFCLPVWGGNEGCRDQFSSAGEYEKKLKGLYLWRCLVKPGNIWWCTLFLRSYVHVNESQLFLIMCVLWLAHTISFLFFILLKKKKKALCTAWTLNSWPPGQGSHILPTEPARSPGTYYFLVHLDADT